MSGFFKFILVANFIMLASLTWLAGPIQKALEKVQHKETVKANYRVCSRIRSMQEVYEQYVRNMFTSGCIAEVKSVYSTAIPESKHGKALRAKILIDLDNEDSEFFQESLNHCHDMAAQYNRLGRITEALVSNIYYQTIKCPAVYEELKKLNISEEELDKEFEERAKQPPQDGE